jgi:hypothetical protein
MGSALQPNFEFWIFVGSWSTSDQWLSIGLKDGRPQTQASQLTVCVIDPHSQNILICFFKPVLKVLNQGECSPTWMLFSIIKHFSVGKGGTHTAWVFHRQAQED